jgi:hypothetical protein
MKELVVLVADKDMEVVIKTLIEKRYNSLGIRKLSKEKFDIYVHPSHDPGVYKRAHEFLRPFINQYRFALVVFDYIGSGQETNEVGDVEKKVKERLESSGWKERCEVVAINPELEIWVWAKSPHVAKVLGLSGDKLDEILKDFEKDELGKPKFPKEAMNRCLRESRVPRSSAIYAELAGKVSLESCKDLSFKKIRDILRKWFLSDNFSKEGQFK